MILKIDTTSGKPVYQQLMDQIKFAVAAGRLAAGDRLPTVRDVAVQVRVNRNTVARVYAELEREGLLYTRAGQGTFVSDRGSGLSRAEQRRQLLPAIDDLLTQSKVTKNQRLKSRRSHQAFCHRKRVRIRNHSTSPRPASSTNASSSERSSTVIC